MLTRDKIIEQAYHECMSEMYAKAQPSADFNQLLKDAKVGKISKDEKVYERYYLSQEEFKYILNKYKKAYNIKSKWEDYVEIIENYLNEGGTKDKYIEACTDKNGNYHPGYRGYENVPPLIKQIKECLKNHKIDYNSLANELNSLTLNTIKDCKDFYRFDREENSFHFSIALGPSPTSNKDTVIEYWKNQGVEINIQDKNPLLFYEMDEYGEKFEEYMIDDYGEDWKKQFDKRWDELKNSKQSEK